MNATDAALEPGEGRRAVAELWSLIQRHLDETGATEAAIARRMNVSPQTVNSWKNRGVRSLPGRASLDAIAEVTKTPYDVVLAAALRDAGYDSPEQGHRHYVVNVIPEFPGKIVVQFADWTVKHIDLSPIIDREDPGVFEALRHEEFFNRIRALDGVVCWPGEINLASESLYANTIGSV